MLTWHYACNIDDDDDDNNNINNNYKNNNEMWMGSNMLEVLHCFIFFHKKVKQNLCSFHVFLVNMIEELQHSEKQLFSSKKNIDIQHR